MSNRIRYDSLLVHYLARELDAALAAGPCRSALLRFGDRAAALVLDGDTSLQVDLHPTRVWIRIAPAPAEANAPPDARVVAVAAPRDDRRLLIQIEGGTRFRPLERQLVIELQTNHENLLLLDGADRMLQVLRPREVGGRRLFPGELYLPPATPARISPDTAARKDAHAAWLEIFTGSPPEEWARQVQRRFAFTGPVNTPVVLPAEGSPEEIDARFERWWELASLPSPRPVLLHLEQGDQPYPLPLPDVAAEPVPSLLQAMEHVAQSPAAPVRTPDPLEEQRSVALRRLRAAEKRVERLQAQLSQTHDASQARSWGDLLLAHIGRIPRGATEIRLSDWEGEEVLIPLDPALSPAENANRWYAEARRQQRVAERVPRLLAEARDSVERWRSILRALEAGESTPSLRKVLEAAEVRTGGGGEAPRFPYRAFTTSGGLQARVGRGSADNDRLTFGHSHPNDVWLHARSVPGSHVILRWSDAEHAPPARDLAEAAGLAAWFSKARTSGLVAVDWTRRKYVRKPRGAPPGQVIPQRVKTIFVEPDPRLAERLGAGSPDPSAGFGAEGE